MHRLPVKDVVHGPCLFLSPYLHPSFSRDFQCVACKLGSDGTPSYMHLCLWVSRFPPRWSGDPYPMTTLPSPDVAEDPRPFPETELGVHECPTTRDSTEWTNLTFSVVWSGGWAPEGVHSRF